MRKSQSAMEYLMTYGWAILAIAIVMVSLYSLGIFNTGSLQPTATPGSCEVVRTVAQTSLAGQCSNLIPKYTARFVGTCYTNRCQNYILVKPSGRLNTSMSTITVSGWIDVKASGYLYNYIVSNDRDGGGVYYGYALTVYNLGPQFRIFDSSGTEHAAQSSSTISTGKWYQLVGTFDGSNLKIYVNGTLMSTSAYSGQLGLPASFPFAIGALGYNPGVYGINGSLANIQVYNTSLDNTTIKALYQEGIGGVPIDVNHLVGWWPLNGNANDYSSNNNQGTASSVVWNANWQSGYTAPAT